MKVDRWAASGAMALTGRADGPPLRAPAAMERLLADLQRTVGDAVGLEVAPLLGERAAIAGLTRAGALSCGGHTRLVRAADGWCAVALAREDDLDLLPAWLGVGGAVDLDNAWLVVATTLANRPRAEVVAQGQLVGLTVAGVGDGPGRTSVVRQRVGEARPRPLAGAVVVDLSSLWAGPLCAQLLQLGGARVIKVESTGRPDGAREGPPAFFDLLHAGQEAVALDFATADGRAALARLVGAADVVIEGSRPRALHQLGIDAAAVARGGPRVWLSITAYGRVEPWGSYVGFGDDAAAAAGLVGWDAAGPVFCADAVADPLTGLTAASAVAGALAAGGHWLLDVSLAGAAQPGAGAPGQAWVAGAAGEAGPPRARPLTGRAPGLGEHTHRVLAELAAGGLG